MRDALERALAGWRDTRAVELADLVDQLTMQIGGAVPPYAHRQAEWVTRARHYDPIAVGPLVASGASRLGVPVGWDDLRARHGDQPLFRRLDERSPAMAYLIAIADRFLAVSRWPDDPRLAGLLVRWLEELPAAPEPGVAMLYEAVGERLVALGDSRVCPTLTWLAQRAPRLSMPHHARTLLVERLLARLPAPVTRTSPPPPLDGLWADAGRSDAARSVLADALAQAGDPRGEVIALQLAGTREAGSRARKLLGQYRDDWLGALAPAIGEASTYERGFLARVVLVDAPPAAYAAAVGHRELVAVDTVFADVVGSADFRAFLAALPREPRRIEVTDDRFAESLAMQPRAIRELRLSRTHSFTQPSLAATLDALRLPAIEAIELGVMTRVKAGEIADVVARLPVRFPTLRRIGVHASHANDRVRALPLVEVFDA